jgi:hypothetical protein
LQPDSDGPDVFKLERSLLADQLSLASRFAELRRVKSRLVQLLLKGRGKLLLCREVRRDEIQSGRCWSPLPLSYREIPSNLHMT